MTQRWLHGRNLPPGSQWLLNVPYPHAVLTMHSGRNNFKSKTGHGTRTRKGRYVCIGLYEAQISRKYAKSGHRTSYCERGAASSGTGNVFDDIRGNATWRNSVSDVTSLLSIINRSVKP
jgi:hypothetical protein